MASRVVVECPSCMARLALPDESKLGKKIRCTKCSEVFVAEVSDEPTRSNTPTRSKSKGKRRSKGQSKGRSPALLIGGGVVAAVLLIGAGVWMFSGGGEPAPEPGQNVTGSAPAKVAVPSSSQSPALGQNAPMTNATSGVTSPDGNVSAAPAVAATQTKPSLDLPPEFALGGNKKDELPLKPLPVAALGSGNATIKISNLIDPDQGQQFADRIRRATKSRSSRSSSNGQQLTLTIDGVGDLKVLADALEIGEVMQVDEASRTISIRANPSLNAAASTSKNSTTAKRNERPFDIQISAKLKPVPLFSGPDALTCTTDGKLDVKNGTPVLFMAAVDRKPVARESRQEVTNQHRAEVTKDATDVVNKAAKPVMLDGLEGVELMSELVDPKSGQPAVVISVILFDEAATFVMTAKIVSAAKDEYLPEIQAMTQSFKRLKSAP